MENILLLVGTHKGAFILRSDRQRKTWVSTKGSRLLRYLAATLSLESLLSSFIFIQHSRFFVAIV